MSKWYTGRTRNSRGKKKVSRRGRSREARVLGIGPHEVRTARLDDQVVLQLPLNVAETLTEAESSLEDLAMTVGLAIAQELIAAEVDGLVGKRYAHHADRNWSRWGGEDGYIVVAGQKAPVRRPRVRSKDAREAELETYRSFQNPENLRGAVLRRMLAGVSTRKYERVLEDAPDAFGIKKSSVSRSYIAASAKKLRELLERDLSPLDLFALMIDGVDFKGHLITVALGIDRAGKKHILGFREGATENAAVCTALLEDLVARGLRTEENLLIVLDGSKALYKAVKRVFSKHCQIHRCQLHKRRNVLDHLPPAYHATVDAQMRAAYNMTSYAEAKKALERLHDYLATINPSAARSLDEGMEETLTLHRLQVPDLLRQSLRTTNPIESCFSALRDFTRRVRRWRDGNMVARWVATGLLDLEKRFRRIRGHREIPKLLISLKTGAGQVKESA